MLIVIGGAESGLLVNRAAAISRARNLIRQRAVQKNNTPVIYCDLDGNLHIKIGNGGLLIRMARNPEPDRAIESEPALS